MNSTYECDRCGAQFGIAGVAGPEDDGTADEAFNELVRWHDEKQCTPLARAPLDRARLLVCLQWDSEDEAVPSEAVATALLAIAEEQRTANLIALLALPSAVKTKAITDAKNRVTTQLLERLGLGGQS